MAFTDQQLADAGELVRSRREALGWTQSETARRLDEAGFPVTQTAVSAWEKGKAMPRPDKFPVIEQVLGLEVGALARIAFPSTEVDADDSPIEISAHGTDLEELRRRDPDTYELLVDMARRRLDQLDDGR